ncbi:protein NRT1/ PTR FAMILY 2.6-like [Lotus japonicus]|uniref:protein NRT1/ PTR FAMILY 2.6-like n=1 Tax=Lotus japonicus TaxID=34305 RepID=UPI002582697F|nr:protein NRT1/ PTR FAMILY 2.6-like [Lotus japonicus]
MSGTPTSHIEARSMSSSGSKPGGWRSFPFIIGAATGSSLASAGIIANLIVYLIQEFNIKSITAAQISNVVNGSSNLFPFLAAIIADSFFGSFSVALISSCVSFLGTVILALTATITSLRPHPCNNDGSNHQCTPPSVFQYTVLYAGTALAAIGFGGARFTTATLGANQFDKPEHQANFFNWFFFTWYISSVIAITALVYVEDNVSWVLGFGVCAVANLIGVVIFLLGYRFYRPDDLKRSALLDLVRVLVVAVRKWKSQLSSRKEDYYSVIDHDYDHDGVGPVLPAAATPGKRLRFFNRAAQITDGDLKSDDGSIEKPWRLCTVQQVEDFKTVIGILPLWSSSIFLGTPIGILSSLTILQALAMDRSLGPHFKIPAGSTPVIALLSTSIFLTLLDRVLWPGWQKLTGKSPTPLQQIGVGHVFNVLALVVSALVESKRLKIAHKHQLQVQHDPTVNMSVLWLFPQLVLMGIGEAFHFPAQVTFYYQQLPQSLRSTSTAMISMLVGIAFYLSTALIDQVRRVTDWLPDDINHGKLDIFYWMLVLLGGINFGYYLLSSTLYKHENV